MKVVENLRRRKQQSDSHLEGDCHFTGITYA